MFHLLEDDISLGILPNSTKWTRGSSSITKNIRYWETIHLGANFLKFRIFLLEFHQSEIKVCTTSNRQTFMPYQTYSTKLSNLDFKTSLHLLAVTIISVDEVVIEVESSIVLLAISMKCSYILFITSLLGESSSILMEQWLEFSLMTWADYNHHLLF